MRSTQRSVPDSATSCQVGCSASQAWSRASCAGAVRAVPGAGRSARVMHPARARRRGQGEHLGTYGRVEPYMMDELRGCGGE
jgi:hypothetical protein